MAYFEVNKKPILTFPTLTGSIVTFNSQYAGLPLKSHKIALTAIQSGSGIPSPDNVRTINGYDSVIIGNCDSDIAYLWTVDSSFTGAVLFNQIYKYNVGNTTTLGVTRSITNGFITFSGETTGAGSGVVLAWSDFTIPNDHKVIVLKDFDLPAGDYIMDQYNGFYANTDITNTIMNIRAGFLIPQLKVSAAGHDYTGISGHLSVIDLTVMFGSTIADYIYNLEQGEAGAGVAFFKHMYPDNYYPYNAGTKEGVGISTVISIGSTVYGGEYDARTGVLTVTHGFKTVNDLTGFDTLSTPANHVYRAYASGLVGLEYTSESVPTNAICSHFDAKAYAPISASDNGKFAISRQSVDRIVFIAQDYSTVSDFLTALGTAQIVYPLATPQTIQLPPCPIDTLLVNNIWADTGDTTLQYPKFG